MAAVVTGLTDPTIIKLQLSWAHVKNTTRLRPLVKLTDPSNNYSAYRALYQSFNTYCIPYPTTNAFKHINGQHPSDHITDADGDWQMSSAKRMEGDKVIRGMLKYHMVPYGNLDKDPVLIAFVQRQLDMTVDINQAYWGTRSQELQMTEIEHADIRRNLKAIGF